MNFKKYFYLMIMMLYLILNNPVFCEKINFYRGETIESIIKKIGEPQNVKLREIYLIAQYKNYGIEFLIHKKLGLKEIWINSDRVYPYDLGIIVGDSMKYVFNKIGAPNKELYSNYKDASSCIYGHDKVLYIVLDENGITKGYKYVCDKGAFWFNLEKRVIQIALNLEFMKLYFPKISFSPKNEYNEEIESYPIVIHGWVENSPIRTSLAIGSPLYFYIISLTGERYGVYYFKENCIIEDIFNPIPQIIKGRRVAIRGIFKKYEEIYPGFSKLNPVIEITNSIEARVITLW